MTEFIHTDCRFYRGSMPCIFHKRDGRLCEGCADYAPVRNRILIIKLAAIGDVLRTTSILPALRQKYPQAEITWITKANAVPLLKDNPEVDRVFAVETDYLEYLQNESFSVGICLDADPFSATINSLARCDLKLGFVADRGGKVQPANDAAREWWLMGVNDALKKRNRKTYQQIMYEICGLALPTVPPRLYLNGSSGSTPLRENAALRHASRIIGINTGGGGRWQLKKWTLAGYIECIKLLKQQHPGTGLVLLGGPEEVELNRQILAAVGDHVVDGGCRNSLMEFAALVSQLDVLLTSDSLAMHIGVALDKPTVVLVGPTSPWELDIFGKGEILHSDIECLACYLSRCDKQVNCMNTLAPEFVVERISRFLPAAVKPSRSTATGNRA
jgi:ADP-heptose:LPS heptosyltransferase